MKQRLAFSVLALLALLVVNTGSVLADGAVTGMSVSRNGGLAITFTVTGYLSPSQLKGGYVQEQGGKSYNLNCAQKDEFTVVCHASGAIRNGATIGFGGSTYWVESEEMPQARESGKPGPYCYPIFGSNDANSPTDFAQIGTRCDPTDDVWGISYEDPYFGTIDFWYEYDGTWVDDPSNNCLASYTDHGDGFYGSCY